MSGSRVQVTLINNDGSEQVLAPARENVIDQAVMNKEQADQQQREETIVREHQAAVDKAQAEAARSDSHAPAAVMLASGVMAGGALAFEVAKRRPEATIALVAASAYAYRNDKVEAGIEDSARMAVLVPTIAAMFRAPDLMMNWLHMSNSPASKRIAEFKGELKASSAPMRMVGKEMYYWASVYVKGMPLAIEGAAYKNICIAQKEKATAVMRQLIEDEDGLTLSDLECAVLTTAAMGAFEISLTQRVGNSRILKDNQLMFGAGEALKPKGFEQNYRFLTAGIGANYSKKFLTLFPYMLAPVVQEQLEKTGLSEDKAKMGSYFISPVVAAPFCNAADVIYKTQLQNMRPDFTTMSVLEAVGKLGFKSDGLGRGLLASMVYAVAGPYVFYTAKDITKYIVGPSQEDLEKLELARKEAANREALISKEAETLEKLKSLEHIMQETRARGLVDFFDRSHRAERFQKAKTEFDALKKDISCNPKVSDKILAEVNRIDHHLWPRDTEVITRGSCNTAACADSTGRKKCASESQGIAQPMSREIESGVLIGEEGLTGFESVSASSVPSSARSAQAETVLSVPVTAEDREMQHFDFEAGFTFFAVTVSEPASPKATAAPKASVAKQSDDVETAIARHMDLNW